MNTEQLNALDAAIQNKAKLGIYRSEIPAIRFETPTRAENADSTGISIKRPSRLPFSAQRPSESLQDWQDRLTARRAYYADHKRNRRALIAQGAALLAYQAIQESKQDSLTVAFSKGASSPAVIDSDVAIALALHSHQSVGKIGDDAIKPADISMKQREDIKAYLSQKFSNRRTSQGKVRNNFVAMSSRYARNVRTYNLMRANEPWKVSKSIPYVTCGPYSDLSSHRTFAYHVHSPVINTDGVLMPFTREELAAPKPSSNVSVRWSEPDGRVSYRQGTRLTAHAAPIASELATLSRRAGYSYPAVLDRFQHSRYSHAIYSAYGQVPTTVSTGQVELTAQYAMQGEHGLYSVYPRVSTLK